MISVYVALAMLLMFAIALFTRGYYYHKYTKKKKEVAKNTGCKTCDHQAGERCFSNEVTMYHPIDGAKEVPSFCSVKNLGCECQEWESRS